MPRRILFFKDTRTVEPRKLPTVYQLLQQALPCHPVIPSLAMIGTMTKPATGSAHHSPNSALSSNPPSRMAERYVQKSVWRASAAIAALPRPTPTLLFARARRGIAINETAATTIPGTLLAGASLVASEFSES